MVAQNILSWNRFTRIIQCSSWPCTAPKFQPGHPWELLELWHSLRSLGSAQHPLGEEPFPDIQPDPP